MIHNRKPSLGGRIPNRLHHINALTRAKNARKGQPLSKRARGEGRDVALPFVPPENWHESTGEGGDYRILTQLPGRGFRHILTPDEIRDRLSLLPERFVAGLEVVQLSRMTRKKLSFPCYGMQWGSSLYLYPIEENLIEYYSAPPKPSQLIEARMYGGKWMQDSPTSWKLVWSEESIKDFYLNNILIHELGHLLDDRNTRAVDRERYAEWFALNYGYKASRQRMAKRPVVRRHHPAPAGDGSHSSIAADA